ncbi:MAG TPA: hypothetical protein VHH34_23655, partial [Pseudonocardiaceae bacterium]|nr:hypothetical protein [Pseudonocardiaceae bacterium]
PPPPPPIADRYENATDNQTTGPADEVRLGRLVESHHLYLGADGGWRLAGPDDTFERLRVSPAVGAALERLLCDQVSYPDAVAEAGDRDAVDRALNAFAERGLLVAAPARGAAIVRPKPVMVLGAGRIAAQVAALLVTAGQPVRRRTAPGTVDLDGASAVIACAGRLTDAEWQELDAACRREGLAWHRCYREGGRHVVGPFSVPQRAAGYRGTRARRLAAARHPAELAASWKHLDSRHVPSPEPGPAISAIVAGILATDLIAFLEEQRIPTAGHQLVIHPDTLVVDRHPVLPLPVAVLEGWAEGIGAAATGSPSGGAP